ncbi:MAG: S24/S26 family peptidase [Clostridia bacterium]|nr:S24/S26 family peptidase [Clostridia bacterium]
MNTSDETVKVQLEDVWDVMAEQLAVGGTVRFMPKGTSMLPMLRQGIDSVVLTAAPEKLNIYDLPLYKRASGQFVLHRVVGIDQNGYIMCGDNQFEREYGIAHSQILAVAKGFYRGDEYVDCTNEQYRKYCKKRVLNRYLYGKFPKLHGLRGKLLRKLHLR